MAVIELPMTPADFSARMNRIVETYGRDPEGCHVEADALLCQCLRENGFGAGVDVFLNMRRNYK